MSLLHPGVVSRTVRKLTKDFALALMTCLFPRLAQQPFLSPLFRPLWVCLALLHCLPALASAGDLPPRDADWELREESEGIRIYTTDYADSSFKAFKAEAVLDVSMDQLMAVMVTPSSCMQWVHNCTEARQFANGTFHRRFAYSVNDMPWPVSDRDYVLRIVTEGHQGSGVVTMHLNAVPDKKTANDDRVRVEKSDTLYRFEPVNDGQTRMTWIQHTEPNGAIPGWLANTLIVDIPLKSMKALAKVAQTEQYKGYELTYDEQGNLAGVIKSDRSRGDEK
jgi:hypothetical protein